MMPEPFLAVHNLRIFSSGLGHQRTIVSGIDLCIERGETVGIVGESGSGKSLTGRALIGLLPQGVHAEGEIRFRNQDLLPTRSSRVTSLRGREVSLLMQDPYTMLNPLLRAGAHLSEMINKKSVAERGVLSRLADVGIRDPAVARRYPFQLSGGMRQRVALAAALARDCELLIADEPSTALDVTTQSEILALLKSIQTARGLALILITHNLRVAFSMCDRIYVLYAGSIMEVGPASKLESEPTHPYTLGLLLSEPPPGMTVERLVAIPGSVPAADTVQGQCAFAPRCAWAAPICSAQKPQLTEVAQARFSACVRVNEIRSEMLLTRQRALKPVTVAPKSSNSVPVIVVSDVSKIFSVTLRHRVTALDGVSLRVDAAESVGLIGESGSGKTTLARCLLGLETPSSGRIVVGDIECSDYANVSKNARKQLRRTIQMVFQDPYSSLNPTLTVGSMLEEAINISRSQSDDRAEGVGELLARVGLPVHYAERKPVALSGGERQRVAIARALAVRPKVLVCDEPASALDVSVQAQILNLFKSLQRDLGMTYLFITHDLAVARQVVDRVYVLCQGAIVESGPVEDVLDKPQHPYTRRLVASIPRSDATWLRVSRLEALSN